MNLRNLNIDKSWTLFLDRDGVINKRLQDDYVKTLSEFEFIEGAPDAIKRLSRIFGRIIVVTNQQGIGKGIYSENDLGIIHHYMIDEIEKHEGVISKIYYSPYLASENHHWRKPGIGMALEAQKEFPDIDFKTSVIVGDSLSDMQFGRSAGMKTVYIHDELVTDEKIDFVFSSLAEFADGLTG